MAQTRLPLVINGTDFSRQADRLQYAVIYEDRTGENTTYLKNGDEYLDIIAKRPVITWPLNMLWADELAALHAAIDAAIYVPVYYFDTVLGAAKIGYFHGTIGETRAALVRESATAFADGAVLTLRSR